MAETWVVEVEVLESRGLFADETLREDEELWIAMAPVSSATTKSPPPPNRQWCRLGRRATFTTPSFGSDRYLFEEAAKVRFEVYVKKKGFDGGPRQSPRYCLFNRGGDTLLGSRLVTPWLERQDAFLENFRWIRLEGGPDATRRRKRRGSSLGPCLPSASDVSQIARKQRHRELRVAVLAKLGSQDRVSAAESCRRWFFSSREPPFSGQRANVVRLAVLRTSLSSAGESFFVAARVRDKKEDPMLSEEEEWAATTRHSEDGVFLQMLTASVRGVSPDDAALDVAVVVAVVVDANTRNVVAHTTIDLGSTLHAEEEKEEGRGCQAEPVWVELSGGWRVLLAWRLDYDETRDDGERRPFFDEELYGLDVFRDDDFAQKDDEIKVRPVNALRVVVARARNLTLGATAQPLLHHQKTAARRGSRGVCGVSIHHYASTSATDARSTTAKAPSYHGNVVWNECFEFAFDRERVSSASDEMVRLVVGGDDFPPREVWADAPRHRVARSWYELGDGAQILIVAQRYFDESLVTQDLRDVALDNLALAFPDLDRLTVERVYDSTADLADACVALGALAAVDGDLLEDDLSHVAASNATDLSWIMSPLVEHVPNALLSSKFLLPHEDDDDDEEEEGDGDERSSSERSSEQLVRCATMTSLLGKHEAADVLEAADLSSLSVEVVFRKCQSTFLRKKLLPSSSSSSSATKKKKKTTSNSSSSSSRKEDGVVETGLEYLDGVRPFSLTYDDEAGPEDDDDEDDDEEASPNSALLVSSALARFRKKKKTRRRLVVRLRTECADFASSSRLLVNDNESSETSLLSDGAAAAFEADATPSTTTTPIRQQGSNSERVATRVEPSATTPRLTCSELKRTKARRAYLRTVAERWARTPFELAKVHVEVLRTPRDFATLRAGLVAKLASADERFSEPFKVPPLPGWVLRALNVKTKTRTVSVAAGIATASIAGAVAVATGVAPVIAVTGGVALGAVALTGAHKTTKTTVEAKINADLATCDWLDRVQRCLLDFPGHAHRRDDAVLFFKQFLARGGSGKVFQRARHGGQLDVLSSLSTAASVGPTVPPPDYLAASGCLDDDSTESSSSQPTTESSAPPPPPPPPDYLTDVSPAPPPPPPDDPAPAVVENCLVGRPPQPTPQPTPSASPKPTHTPSELARPKAPPPPPPLRLSSRNINGLF